MCAAPARPRTRRQHYVPACYLSQFASPNERTGRLMVFDRQTGVVRPSTPCNEARACDFYAVEFADRSDANIVEDALAKLEDIFAPAIARINGTSGLPAGRHPCDRLFGVRAAQEPPRRRCDEVRDVVLHPNGNRVFGPARDAITQHEPADGGGPRLRRGAQLGGVSGGRLAHVMDQQDGDVVLALQGTQGAEHGGDVARAVFVEAGDQPDEGVEDEQSG